MLLSDVFAASAGTAAAPSPIASMAPLVFIFAIFYFLLIRPQQKKMKEHQNMVAALEKGARVLTSGGLIGVITKATAGDAVLEIEIASGVKVEVTRQSVTEVLVAKEKKAESAAPAKKKAGKKK